MIDGVAGQRDRLMMREGGGADDGWGRPIGPLPRENEVRPPFSIDKTSYVLLFNQDTVMMCF